ncbi:antitoxin VapB [Jatrophihabitans endophyticus]|uniref:Antitoxin VapB n=1 Tax=Jatrophihabitans endophyticus TaxID=1206085 RepID=A0A1M5ERQ4_9ACTN|nr:type II toxin-antitoxin system VapB family antitoxin [Jatrophihabitans endophyticus]SHF81800.1 antitoxin VapB [Jatrophihabitans endophyticus]
MSLNIKNETVHELVREAARRTGRSQTSVVEVALRRYLDELSDHESEQQRDAELDSLVRDMQRRWRDSTEPPFTAEDLYDPETGLPA